MIDYVEIRDKNRAVIGNLDMFKSIIWNVEYYGTGDFEIYAPYTEENAKYLKVGHYVTRLNEKNVGIIEHIKIAYTALDGRMITVSGRFAKSILAHRLIYNLKGNSLLPVESSGNVETAMRKLVNDNMIAATDTKRNVAFLELGAISGLTPVIVDESGAAATMQTSYANLLEYTDSVLKEYAAGAYIGINRSNKMLQYIIYGGANRSAENEEGNAPLIFSQMYDNFLSGEYDFDNTALKNTALVGGSGEGTERFVALMAGKETGLDRREVFIEATDQSKTYQDGDETKTYTDAVYKKMLITKAKQSLIDLVAVEKIGGDIDITNSGLKVGVDFYAGDIVTMRDDDLEIYAHARIVKITEVQDDNGYNITVGFEGAGQ